MASTSTTSWVGRPRIATNRESTQLILLTTASIGLTFCWGTELTYCAPYLLSLGLSKSKLSLVWLAGPLSGLIMQPVIGTISDKWTGKLGRRRPFMIAGAALVAVCLFVLGWTSETVRLFLGGSSEGVEREEEEERLRRWTAALAVLDIFVLDFVLNIAQTTCHALVVDTLPVAKQQLGAAWAGRMSGVANMLVYAIGALDLDALLGNFLGDTQLKKVCMIAAIAMIVSQGITCLTVTERVLVAEGKGSGSGVGIWSVISQIYNTTRNVPEQIQAICRVQFWSWIGWFFVNFYGSTWVGEIYLRHEAPQDVGKDKALDDVGRQGSQAFIIFAIVYFIFTIVLPWFVRSPDDEDGNRHSYTARPPRRLAALLENIQPRKPTLLTVWTIANLVFAATMIFAPFVKSVSLATMLIAICAVPRSVRDWAPAAFLGVEVNRLSGDSPSSSSLPTTSNSMHASSSYHRISNDSIELEEPSSSAAPKTLHLRHSSTASLTPSSSTTGELSGIYLGILNIYTTLPQFVGTGISWIVFSILEPGKSPELAQGAKPEEMHSKEGISGIGVCLFIGAVCAVVAAWATRGLRKGDWQDW